MDAYDVYDKEIANMLEDISNSEHIKNRLITLLVWGKIEGYKVFLYNVIQGYNVYYNPQRIGKIYYNNKEVSITPMVNTIQKLLGSPNKRNLSLLYMRSDNEFIRYIAQSILHGKIHV